MAAGVAESRRARVHGAGNKRAEESLVAELERKVGRQAMEIGFLKRAWQHLDALSGRILDFDAGVETKGGKYRSFAAFS